MSQTNLYYEFYFKIPYTTNTFTVHIHQDTTIEKFKEIVFERCRTLYPDFTNNLFEIVEAGKFYNINGRDPELAPAINYPEDTTLREIYHSIWKSASFYIRPILIHQN